MLFIGWMDSYPSNGSNSSPAELFRSTAGRGSDSGTNASLPGGFTTYFPRI